MLLLTWSTKIMYLSKKIKVFIRVICHREIPIQHLINQGNKTTF